MQLCGPISHSTIGDIPAERTDVALTKDDVVLSTGNWSAVCIGHEPASTGHDTATSPANQVWYRQLAGADAHLTPNQV